MTGPNILPLQNLAHKRKLRYQRNALKKYFGSLSFGQIIDECSPVIINLKANPTDMAALARATELLREYKRRLGEVYKLDMAKSS